MTDAPSDEQARAAAERVVNGARLGNIDLDDAVFVASEYLSRPSPPPSITYSVVAYDAGGYGDDRSKTFKNESDAVTYASSLEKRFGAIVMRHIKTNTIPEQVWPRLQGQTAATEASAPPPVLSNWREIREECARAVTSQGFYRDESGERAAEIIRALPAPPGAEEELGNG